jgi:hypothetical protein
MVDIEKLGGVGTKQRHQTNIKKTQAEQYSDHHNLKGSAYVHTEVLEDRGSKRTTRVIGQEE